MVNYIDYYRLVGMIEGGNLPTVERVMREFRISEEEAVMKYTEVLALFDSDFTFASIIKSTGSLILNIISGISSINRECEPKGLSFICSLKWNLGRISLLFHVSNTSGIISFNSRLLIFLWYIP